MNHLGDIMSDIDTMTIGEARAAIQRGKEVENLFGAGSRTSSNMTMGDWIGKCPQIVILDRGFIYVGDVAIENDWLIIRNARNVRRWGTSKGLGELAKDGPKPETKIDPAGTVRAPLRSVIGLLECEASSWIK